VNNVINMKPFGTTMVAALYQERPKDHKVDVLYLSAGDSRCYVLDSIGFRQAVDDQSENDVITSNVDLERAQNSLKQAFSGPVLDITISPLPSREYETPCVLFCMTDGIYNCFGVRGVKETRTTPMFMEYNLLRQILKCNDEKELEEQLQDIFSKYSGVDDSHSMSIACFGIDTYDELKAFAQKRIQKLNSMLENCANDIFITDYQRRRIERQRTMISQQFAADLQNLYTEDKIRDFCLKELEGPARTKYCADLEKLNRSAAQTESELAEIHTQIENMVSYNYLPYAEWYVGRKGQTLPPIPLITEIREKQSQMSEKRTILTSLVSNLIFLFTGYSENVQRSSSDNANISKLNTTYTEFTKRDSDMRQTSRLIPELNRNLALNAAEKANPQLPTPAQIVDGLLEEGIPFGNPADPEYEMSLRALCGNYSKKKADLDGLKQKIQQMQEQAIKRFWEDHAVQLYISNTHDDLFIYSGKAQGVKERIEKVADKDQELKTLKFNEEKQTQVFNDYLNIYLLNLSQSRADAIRRSGWRG